MKTEIEEIKDSIKIINHNSTRLSKRMKSLCIDFKEFKEVFQKHNEEYIATNTDVKSIKRMVWWMLTVIVVGSILAIFSSIVVGIFFLVLR